MTIPRLHVVTDDEVLARGGFRRAAVDVMKAGGEHVALHIRGPRSDGRAVFEAASELAPWEGRTGARLLVNDRVDIALAAGLRGVHLGRRSLPIRDARALLGREGLIGSSCHDPSEVRAAADEGADFVFVGTIFSTPSHPESAGLGCSVISESRLQAGELPVIAIGGITSERVDDVLRAGAHGVAALRGVWASENPARAVGRLLDALRAASIGGVVR